MKAKIKYFITLFFLLSVFSLEIQSQTKSFHNVIDFGEVPNGKTICTAAIQKQLMSVQKTVVKKC